MSLWRLALTLLWLLLLLGVWRTLWLQPQEPWKLPFQEVSLSFSRDARLLCLDAQRGALASSRAFGRRNEWAGEGQLTDIHLVDLVNSTSRLLSQGLHGQTANGSSYAAQLSRDGQRLVFCSEASNLVPDDLNGCQDVFLLDLASRKLRRLASPEDSAGHSPSSLPSVSADGSLVAFSTYGAGEVRRRLVLQGPADAPVSDLWGTPGGAPLPTFGTASFSPVRASVAFSRFTRPYGPRGRWPSAEIWAGNVVTPPSGPLMLAQRSRLSSRTDGESPNGPSFAPCLAETACAFVSAATDLVTGDTNARWDIFVYDQARSATTRVSVGSAGQQANEDSFDPWISDDGRYVVFSSYASNLVAGDSNGHCDVFLHDRTSRTTHMIGKVGADGPSYNPVISGDGSRVAFASLASNLEDRPVQPGQVYVWDRRSQRLQRVVP